ncbi:unnamed protein product, partial [Urochloa humidicola]
YFCGAPSNRDPARFCDVPPAAHTKQPTRRGWRTHPVAVDHAHPRGQKGKTNHLRSPSSLLIRNPPNPVRPPRKTLAPATMKGKADTSKKGEGRLKAGGGAGKRKKAAATGKPKRPPSAFFVFMSEFRQEYNAQHPDNKSVAAVSKAAGEKWRAMSEEEKQPYVDQAGHKKQDYEQCYMDTGAGVGVRLGCGCPIRHIFLGHAKYHLESDTSVGIRHGCGVSDSAKNLGHGCPGNTDYEKTKANFDKKESTSSKKAKTQDDEGSDKSKSEIDDEDDEENEEDD